MPPASHFIFIPTVLLLGVVIGWILGQRAMREAEAAKAAAEERKARRRAGASP